MAAVASLAASPIPQPPGQTCQVLQQLEQSSADAVAETALAAPLLAGWSKTMGHIPRSALSRPIPVAAAAAAALLAGRLLRVGRLHWSAGSGKTRRPDQPARDLQMHPPAGLTIFSCLCYLPIGRIACIL